MDAEGKFIVDFQVIKKTQCLLVFLSFISFILGNDLSAQDNRIPDSLQKLGVSIEQAVVVESDLGNGFQAQLKMFERKNGHWFLAGGPMEAVIGKNGLAILDEKREGDGKTPSGVFPLGTAFGYEANVLTKLFYRQVTENDFWVDDSSSDQYNQWVNGLPRAP